MVVLVDSRIRDLAVATLIAHHLDELGVDCFLEPLEAYRAVLGAYRPNLILFNHLTAGHLVAYSKRLAGMGVLTAVLPNEGILYDADDLRFGAGVHHSGAHIDYFFCWNEPHRMAILENGWPDTHVEVIGVPRFDFYFEPWLRAFRPRERRQRQRPRILLCTNFGFAWFWNRPKEQADRFFAGWKDRIPLYRNYWKAVEDSFNGQQRVLDYAAALIAADRYELILRPHPREDPKHYEHWYQQLPAEARKWVKVDSTSNITSLILDCDLELSCELCTTALESWIAGKPTIELIFSRNPLLFNAEHSASNISCESPAALPTLVGGLLREGEDAALLAARRRHLEKWCSSPSGNSARRLAEVIARAVHQAQPVDWSGLGVADRRRSTKLRLLRNLGLAYHFDPLMPLKMRVNRVRYAGKNKAYEKSIKPRDVADARRQLAHALRNA